MAPATAMASQKGLKGDKDEEETGGTEPAGFQQWGGTAFGFRGLSAHRCPVCEDTKEHF